MNALALNAAAWLGWLLDRHFPAVLFAALLLVLLVLEVRRPR